MLAAGETPDYSRDNVLHVTGTFGVSFCVTLAERSLLGRVPTVPGRTYVIMWLSSGLLVCALR